MKYFLTILIFSISFLCSAQNDVRTTPGSFTLSGELIGRDTGYIVLWFPDTSGAYVKDTSYLQNGRFTFKGVINEPSFVHLIGSHRDGNYANFFLENGNQTILLYENHFDKIEMTGSESQILYDSLKKAISKSDARSHELSRLEATLDSTIKFQTDTLQKKAEEKKLEEFVDEGYRLSAIITNTTVDFIKSHPASYVSATELYGLLIVHWYHLNSAMELYEGLDNKIKNSRKGLMCLQEIQKRIKLTAGYFVPDFYAIDLKGQKIDLHQFKGKYVLLDFWASWCVPCRTQIPKLKRIYSKYHSQGFEIISISFDKNLDNWKKAIQIEGIQGWVHLLKQGELASIFKTINQIPKQILLDQEGKIIWSSFDVNTISWEDALKNQLKNDSVSFE